MNVKLKGKVVSGDRQASFFTQLDWVQEQCIEKLGFRPYPGTLNIMLDGRVKDRETLRMILRRGIDLVPPNPKFCPATMLPVFIKEIKGAIVLPSEEVNIHEKNIIEIIAPLKLRDVLRIEDGDTLMIEIDEKAVSEQKIKQS